MRMLVMTTEDLYSDSRRQVEKEYRLKVQVQIEVFNNHTGPRSVVLCVSEKPKLTLKPLIRTG